MWTQILSLVLQALVTRGTAFAVTIGGKHLAVTITETSSPGNSGSFIAILQIIGQILSGQTGTFQFGVFSVTVQVLGSASNVTPTLPREPAASPQGPVGSGIVGPKPTPVSS